MKISALIVDDEPNCRLNLKLLLEEFCPEVTVTGLAENTQKARELISKFRPDLVFLDIAMPNEDGMTMLENMKERDFAVVFTTAHNEYALKAFKEDAVDYLEKPLNIDDLQNTIRKVQRFLVANTIDIEEHFSQLDNLKTNEYHNKISIPTKEGYLILNNDEIVHLEACDNYTKIFVSNGKRYLSSKNIKVYEDMLNPKVFFRSHKSHIINLANHLKEFSRAEGNVAVMTSGVHVPIARRKISEFLAKINQL
jgi:two-component system, LytTR family, response regulator